MLSETDLVIALSRMPVRSEARKRVRQVLEQSIDWDAVKRLATRWQVEPTVFGNLGSEFATAIPTEVRSEAAMLEQLSRAHAVSRTLLLMELVDSLAGAGIPAIVLKGPAIAIIGYDDCSRRTFGDADLLLRRDDLIRGRDFLLARGYTAHFHPARERAMIAGQSALEFSDSRSSVELHWTLVSRHLRFNLRVEDLWSRSQLIQCVGSEMRVLSPEHLFLYLCAHGAKHEWSSFRWICDIAQLAARLTPSQAGKVMELAAEANAKRLLALALRLAQEVFGEEPSPFPSSAFGDRRDTAALVSLVSGRLIHGKVDKGLLPPRIAGIHRYMEPLAFWLRSRERTRDQIACAAEFIFVPAAGDNSRNQLQRVFRPIRLAANAVRRLASAS